MSRPVDQQAILEAAILAAAGLSQTAIGRHLRKKQSAIARRLDKAELFGWLTRPAPPAPVLDESRLPPGLLEAARARLSFTGLGDELRKRLEELGRRTRRPVPHSVTIVGSPNYGTEPAAWEQRQAVAARAGAARLLEVLPRVQRLGLLWGKTLRAVVEDVCAADPRRAGRVRGPVTVVPLCGQPLFLAEPNPVTLSASTLAARLAECLNYDPPAPIDLAVPAFIPGDFAEHMDLLARFFAAVPSYRKVFGAPGESGLADELDTIVTGAGSAESGSSDPWQEARRTGEGREPADWERLIAGDLGGVVFPRVGLTGPARRRARAAAQAINDRALGIRLGHFQRCAKAAAGGQRPGVLAVTVGASKAMVLYSAVAEGCVSDLVVDDELAKELSRLIREDAG